MSVRSVRGAEKRAGGPSPLLRSYFESLKRKTLYRSYGYDVDGERRRILREAGAVRGKVLEVGTGKGYLTLALAKKFPRVTTLDNSASEQRFARMVLRLNGAGRRVCFRRGDAERLCFRDGCFDAVFSVNTLHHLKRRLRAVDEMIRILAPGGVLTLSDFSRAGHQMVDRIHAREGRTHDFPPTDMKAIRKQLLKKGFSVRVSGTRFQSTLTARRRTEMDA